RAVCDGACSRTGASEPLRTTSVSSRSEKMPIYAHSGQLRRFSARTKVCSIGSVSQANYNVSLARSRSDRYFGNGSRSRVHVREHCTVRGRRKTFAAASPVGSKDGITLQFRVTPCPARELQCPTFNPPTGAYTVSIINDLGASN